MSNILSDVIDYSGAGLVYNPYKEDSKFNGGLFGGGVNNMFSDNKSEIPLKQVPEYPESTAARELWGKTLMGYSPENSFGAASPDWASIWADTQKKINQTYWGSPTSTGAIGKVKASAARRNVSDSPALQTQIGRLGAQEAQDIASAKAGLNAQQMQLTESARQNWLSGLSNLSGQQANYYYPQYEESGLDKFIKLLSSGAQIAGAFA